MESFKNAMSNTGIEPPSEILTDGMIHRFHVSGDKPNSLNGWYVLHGGTPAAGAFGYWRDISEAWCSKEYRSLTTKDKASFKASQELIRKQREEAQAVIHAECRKESQKIWAAAKDADPKHTYIIKKGIKPKGIKQHSNGSLIIPLKDLNNTLHGLQFIHQDGAKRFKTGTLKTGNCFIITGATDKPILVCEGYATGASLHEATGSSVVIAFDAGNLLPVARGLKEKLPARKLILCADNDQWTAGNPGLTKATAAAKEIGAMLAIPVFKDTTNKHTDFNDLHLSEGLNAVKSCIEAATEPVIESTIKCEGLPLWAEPVPFNDYSGLPDFPIDVLPDIGREMVRVISEVNQVDLGLTASNYLSVLSASLGRKAEINLISHKEPLNIFTCGIYDSGNRKSSTQGAMTKPLYEYQERMQEAMKEEIRDSQNAYRIREARLAKLQKQAANAKDYTQQKEFEIEAAAIAKEIEENPVVKSPIYIMDDVTTEALAIHMAENNKAMSIFSTEGGIFQTMAGRYDKGVNIDLYLKAHAGDPFSVHRIGREARTMQAPCLTMCLTVQPDVIREIGKNEQFKGRGLLARFLYSLCKSQVGYRERQTKAVPEPILNRYRQHIFSLMEIPQAEHELRFTPEAQGIWDEFYNDVEAEMRPGGSLEYLTDWGSKLPGAVARIAGLLHFAEHGAEAITKDISAGIAVASCVIGGYFKDHALATFGLMQADHRIESAKKILSYIKRQKPDTFKCRDVIANINAFKSKTIADDVMPGINILIERGYIRPMEKHHSSIGRPEAMAYEVNPKIKMECYKTTSNNSKSHALVSSAGFAGDIQGV